MTASFEDQLALLCELQEIDLNLHKFDQKLSTLPEKLAEVESAYTSAVERLEAARGELSEIEKSRRTDESELANSVDHLRQREAKLYAIKTNKEYQAALKEISEGKRINREREDRIIQSMEKIESLTQEITQLETEYAEKEGAFSALRAEVEKETLEIKRQVEAQSARRPALVKQIDKDTLRKYETVRQRHAQSLVGVAQGICQGCSTRIPPQLYNEMLRRNEFKVCPSCQRLLYVVAVPAGETETKTQDA